MTIYNVIITALCAGFAGGFGYFLHKWLIYPLPKREGESLKNYQKLITWSGKNVNGFKAKFDEALEAWNNRK